MPGTTPGHAPDTTPGLPDIPPGHARTPGPNTSLLGPDEKLEVIAVADILAIVSLEQGKLCAQSKLVLKRKLFALRNQRMIEEPDDVPKPASAVSSRKRGRPKVPDPTEDADKEEMPDLANGGSPPGYSLRSSSRLQKKRLASG